MTIITNEDANKIHHDIAVLGLRKDYKQRKWCQTIYDGVPYTGEPFTSEKASNNGHFVYKARFHIGDAKLMISGTSRCFDIDIVTDDKYRKSILFNDHMMPQIIKGIISGEYPVLDKENNIVEITFILNKTGRYIYAEPVFNYKELII